MAEILDLMDKIKMHYKFTQHELRGLIIAILVMAFVFSYDEWGPGSTFVFSVGIYNFFNAVLIAALSILVHDAGQRIWALAIGYRLEFKMWYFGLIISLVAALITKGSLPLIIPAGFMLHHLAGHRLGFFRYGINYFGQAMVALAGPLSNADYFIENIKRLFPQSPDTEGDNIQRDLYNHVPDSDSSS